MNMLILSVLLSAMVVVSGCCGLTPEDCDEILEGCIEGCTESSETYSASDCRDACINNPVTQMACG